MPHGRLTTRAEWGDDLGWLGPAAPNPSPQVHGDDGERTGNWKPSPGCYTTLVRLWMNIISLIVDALSVLAQLTFFPPILQPHVRDPRRAVLSFRTPEV